MSKAANSFPDYYKIVGENIKLARINKGITMQQLGEDIGMDRAAISKIEAGKNITLETLAKISAALEVQPVSLVDGLLVVSDYELEAYVVKRKYQRRTQNREKE